MSALPAIASHVANLVLITLRVMLFLTAEREEYSVDNPTSNKAYIEPLLPARVRPAS